MYLNFLACCFFFFAGFALFFMLHSILIKHGNFSNLRNIFKSAKFMSDVGMDKKFAYNEECHNGCETC